MRIIAITRDLGGDDRRQKIVEYFRDRFEVICITPQLPLLAKLFNLAISFSPHKATWREQSKKNAFYFAAMSRAIRKAVLSLGRRPGDVVMTFEALFSPGTGADILKPFVIFEDGTTRMAIKRWPGWVPATARTKRYTELEAECYESAEHIFTTSDWVRQSFIDDYRLSPEKLSNIGQGHDFSPPPKLSICEGPILFVGYEFERKGGRILLEAFRRIRQKYPTATLSIVGPEMNIDEPGVTILGKVTDKTALKKIYLEAGIFVLPSTFDPNPHAAMEAMAMGLPTIVSDGCGTQEIIEDGVSGFVVPAGSVEALTDRLDLLLGDGQKRIAMGRKGAQRIKDSSQWPLVADQIIRRLTLLFSSP